MNKNLIDDIKALLPEGWEVESYEEGGQPNGCRHHRSRTTTASGSVTNVRTTTVRALPSGGPWEEGPTEHMAKRFAEEAERKAKVAAERAARKEAERPAREAKILKQAEEILARQAQEGN